MNSILHSTQSIRPLSATAAALLCASLSIFAAPALAGEDEIVADRPDFTNSSSIVGKGRVVLETSVAHERDSVNGVKATLSSTPTTLRVGLSENFEIRIDSNGALRFSESGTRISGSADTGIGFKLKLADGDEKSGTPGIAFLARAELASGSQQFRGDGTRPSALLVADWDLPNEVSVGLMTGAYREQGPSGKYTGYVFSATTSKGWTDKFRTFAEIAAQQITAKKDGGNVVTFDVGATYIMTKDVQLDFAYYHGINKEAPDASVTVGVSVRF